MGGPDGDEMVVTCDVLPDGLILTNTCGSFVSDMYCCIVAYIYVTLCWLNPHAKVTVK